MEPGVLYHIFNRGNNKQKIFFNQENYRYFLRKVVKHFLPHVDILAYCLMPNYFHFLVSSKETVIPSAFSNDLRVLLSSYTRAINNQERKTGSLFQQNTKIKDLGDERLRIHQSFRSSGNYPLTCFHYIHQNPLKAGMVNRMEDYEMSSFCDYAGLRNDSICNMALAIKLLDLPFSANDFINESYQIQIIRDQSLNF